MDESGQKDMVAQMGETFIYGHLNPSALDDVIQSYLGWSISAILFTDSVNFSLQLIQLIFHFSNI
jgi:hypothetical protein